MSAASLSLKRSFNFDILLKNRAVGMSTCRSLLKSHTCVLILICCLSCSFPKLVWVGNSFTENKTHPPPPKQKNQYRGPEGLPPTGSQKGGFVGSNLVGISVIENDWIPCCYSRTWPLSRDNFLMHDPAHVQTRLRTRRFFLGFSMEWYMDVLLFFQEVNNQIRGVFIGYIYIDVAQEF